MMRSFWKNFWKDTRGQDLIEYALIAGFIALAAVAVLPGLRETISTVFSNIDTELRRAAGGGS